MQQMILVIGTLLLLTSASVGARAQATEKKETQKKETTTIDAWREALPSSEQSPYAVADESKDNAEEEEAAAEIEKRVIDLELKLMEALKRRDSVTLKSLLADDFLPAGVNIVGSQSGKTRYVSWALKNLELKSYDIEKITVRVYAATAVATVHYKRQAAIGGSPSDGDFVATDVWVKRGKLWQAVSHHISELPKPATNVSRPAQAKQTPE